MWDKVIKGACLVAGAIAGLYGEWTTALSILAIMMGVDYITSNIIE